MPTIPTNTKCSMLACTNLRSRYTTMCIDHGGYDTPKATEKRKAANRLYQTAQWDKRRAIELSRSPLCAGCLAQGKTVSATVVDHIFPWTHFHTEAFYDNDYQTLCTMHHAEKSGLEHRGIYRRYGSPTRDLGRSDYALRTET